MRIILTGSEGFIGGALKVRLSDKHRILCIDKIAITNNNLSNYRLDLLNCEALCSLVNDFRPEVIIHCAARTDLDGRSLEDYRDNHVATKNIVIAAEQLQNKPLILFFSSMLVHKLGDYSNDFGMYNPSTVYGESKVLVEEIARAYNGDYIIVRPTSIWGPGFKEPYRTFFDLIRTKRFIGMPTKSMSTKTYGYINDVIDQVEFIVEHNEQFTANTIVYLSSNYYIKIGEWADLIYNLCHKRDYPRLPFFVFKLLGKVGNILKFAKLRFPITSFRLKNMTSDNIIPYDQRFSGIRSKSLKEATIETLTFLENE